jgi:CRP/FNR family transcriptional regulator
MDNKSFLSQCALCAGLDDGEIDAVSNIARIKKIRKGEIIFIEGDPADGFFILLTGKVRVYKASPEGKEYTIHQIMPGQIFAEAAIFKGTHFPANCAALEDSMVAFFPKDAFVQLIKNSPQISLKIIGSMSAFLREFNQKVEELSLKEISARLASFILTESERKKSSVIDLDMSKAELARRLGTIGETLSRNLKKLKELGAVDVNGKKISILDRDRLISISEGEKI